MRAMLCVLVACQVLQVLGIGLGLGIVGPPAYSLVVETRSFVDERTLASFRSIVHDLEVVTHDLNLVEIDRAPKQRQAKAKAKAKAKAVRRLEHANTNTTQMTMTSPVSFHTILATTGRIATQVDRLLPTIEHALSTIEGAEGGTALPHFLHDARRLAERVVLLLESDAPNEALRVARDMTDHVGDVVRLVEAPNGSVAPLLNASAHLAPRLDQALDADTLQRAINALARTWDKSARMIDFVARTLNEDRSS